MVAARTLSRLIFSFVAMAWLASCTVSSTASRVGPAPPIPIISISDVTSIQEGQNANFVVTLSFASDNDVLLSYQTSDGTATQPLNYTKADKTLVIPAGQTSATVTITTVDDGEYEPDMNFTVNFLSAVNGILPPTAQLKTVILQNIEAVPTVQFVTAADSVLKNVAGGNYAAMVVLSGKARDPVTVAYSATSANAILGTDYNFTPGTLIIPGGVLTKPVNVTILPNNISEPTRVVDLSLASPSSNATLGANTQEALSIIDTNGPPKVQFSSATSFASEAVANHPVTVTLSNPSVSQITVNYAVSGGTAVSGTNYTLAAGTLTFAPMSTSQTINITVMDDHVYTGNLTVDLVLSAPVNATLGTQSNHIHTIIDAETEPLVEFQAATSQLTVATSPHIIPVTISNAAGLAVKVNYAVTGGTAVNGVDYTLSNGTLTFAPGQLSASISVPVINTNLWHAGGGQTIQLTLSSPVNATLGVPYVHTHTILDAVSQPLLSVNNINTDAGSTIAFVASINKAAAQNVTFNYSTANGTAVQPTDYALTAGTATILAGQTSVTLANIATQISSGGKNFDLNLSSIAVAAAGSTTGVATMNVVPTISLNSVTTNAGNNVNFVVTLSKATTNTVTFNYASADGTAIAGTDYTASLGSATIAAGSTTLTLPAIATQYSGGGKNFTMTLSAITKALAGTTTGTANLNVMPTLSVGNTSADAGSPVYFVVTASQASTQPMTFNYATADGTAVAGTNYTAATGTATIAAGATGTTLPAIATNISGNGKNFTLTISSPVNSLLGAATGTANLIVVPTLSLGNVTANAGTSANFVVTLSQATTQAIAFNYATANGTATAGADYTSVSGTATIAAGATTLTLPGVRTQISSGGKNFTMTLSAPVNAILGTATGTATMIVMPTLNIGNVTTNAGTNANFVVTLSQASPQAITFNYATANGTALAGTDYTSVANSATIAAGATTLTLPGVVTQISAGGKNFTMNLSSPTNAVAGTVTGTAQLIVVPTLNIGNITANAGTSVNFVVTLSAATTQAITFNYTTANGTALSPADYATIASSATIAAGATSLTLPVVTTQISSGGKNFSMNLSSIVNAVGGTISGVATMVVMPTINIGNVTTNAGTNANFVVTLSTATTQAITFNYATANGTASAGSDYTSSSGSATVAAGATTLTLPGVPTAIVGGGKNFDMVLTSISNAVAGTTTGVASLNVMPTINIGNVTTNAGTNANFVVTLSQATTQPITFSYATASGTATSGADFTATSGSATIAAGATTLTLPAVATQLSGGGKNFTMNLSSITSAVIGTTAGTATLNIMPALSVGNLSTNAGTNANFVVSLAQASTQNVTFNYATSDGTAVSGTDYTALTGTATMAAGSTSLTLPGVTTQVSGGGKNLNMNISSIVNAVAGTTTGVATLIVVPTININNVTANAGNNVNFVVTLSAATTQAIAFSYATADGTAHQPGDYASASGTATIAAGATTLTLPAVTTQIAGGGKNFTMALSSLVNAIGGTTTGTASLNIMPTINIGNVTTNAGTNANFVVTLSQSTTQPITFSYATASGTAIAGTDFTAATGSATIAAGATTLTLPGVVTQISGGGKNFTMNLSAITSAVVGTTTGTANLNLMPTVSVGNTSANAGNNVNFVVTLSQASTQAITFNYATSDGTALAGTDYTAATGSATVAAGATTLTLPAVPTNISGNGKNFNMTISSVANSVLGTATGTATLTVVPTLNISNVTTNAGTNANFVVTLSQTTTQAITFNYATANGTATAGTDYTSLSGSATMAAGATTLTLPSVTTQLSGGGKAFTMSVSAIVNAIGGVVTGTANLTVMPTVSIANLSTNAGTNANFVVTLSQSSPQNITFNYATANGTASAGTDYTSSSGTATIAAGATTLTLPGVTTQVSGGGKNFTMTLSSVANGVLGTATGTATLIVVPTISVANLTTNAGTNANFVVSLSQATTQAITFNYATANGTASAGTDYTASSGTATIAAGATTLTLPGVVTQVSGGGKNFTLSLNSLVNAIAGATTGTATLTVVPTINISSLTTNAGTNANFVVTLSQATTQSITFNYATGAGTATAGTDYTSASASATISAGATTLTLPAVATQVSGGGKTFNMVLSSIVNAVSGTTTGTATLTVVPTISIANLTTNALICGKIAAL